MMNKARDVWFEHKEKVITAVLVMLCTGSVSSGLNLLSESSANPVYVGEQANNRMDVLEVAIKTEISSIKDEVSDSLSIHSARIDSLRIEIKHNREMDSIRSVWKDSISSQRHNELIRMLKNR
jgi:hypothetical protein